jgi:hypothetical protein
MEICIFRLLLTLRVGFYCEIVELEETQNAEWEASQVCVEVNKLKDRLSQETVLTRSLVQ